MWTRKVLICVLLVYSCDALRQCSDCKLFRSCPEAISFTSNSNKEENEEKLKSTYCGVEVVKGLRLPKVCCSEYATNDFRLGSFGGASEDSIRSHPNIGLLPEECGKSGVDRIIGGTVAKLWEFPWMVLVSHRTRTSSGKGNKQFKCGASIISSRYILTAAHCVVNKQLAGVRIGEFDINSKEDCQGEIPNISCENHIQDIAIEESIPHKDYQRSQIINDIALLRLKKPIDFTHKNAGPICLPLYQELRSKNVGGRVATVSGWGITDNGTNSPILQKVDIPILTAAACRDIYNRNSGGDVTMNKFCAGELNKDSCKGDSGGPLMLEDEIEGKVKNFQYGIVSYGPQQCGSLFPGVYTDVTKYIGWILDNMKP